MMTRRNASAAKVSSSPAEIGVRMTRRLWRPLAVRIAWLLTVVWILAAFAWSLPGQLYAFQHPSARSAELAPDVVAALHQVGVPLAAYAWIAVVFGSLVMLVATALALLLFWRRGDDWMVLLVALLFPAYCLESIGPSEAFNSTPSGSLLAVGNTVALATVTFAVIYAVFPLFPSGRFVPSWSWILLVLCVVWSACRTVAPTVAILILGYPLFLGAAIACQIYRYWKVSTPVQRQQTRWAVVGLVTALLANQAFWFTSGFTPLGKTIYPAIAYMVLYSSVLLIPISFFIAIQRYRLYEIDIIIRRTLIYGTLTAILAGVYFTVVLSVQTVARSLTGQPGQQPVVIVATTLLIAVLFTPLRRRVQAVIDRAFYRRKYNASRTLATFAAQMRMETDLEDLRAHLEEVVRQTVQPEHVSVWLRQRQREHERHPNVHPGSSL